MTFDFFPVRLRFTALDAIRFPAGKAGNVLRGTLGMTSGGARLLRPAVSAKSPSGLVDPPRPFVLRPRPLDGRVIAAGKPFDVLVHLFDLSAEALDDLAKAFQEAGAAGMGPGRGRAVLEQIDRPADPVRLSLDAAGPVMKVAVEFLSPTELKPSGPPEFATVFARARDRVSTLRALYGPGPLELDFRGMGERARLVEMVRCDVREVEVERKSSRTGQVHGIGGFVGVAEYWGDLGAFLPVLRAAEAAGIGRHTVWGNGEIVVRLGALQSGRGSQE